MIRLAARRLWTRRLQALAPLVALLAATLGFQAVLVSARSTQSHVQGVIAANWNPPYDLLVRPSSLVTGLKTGDHLLQPNYLESAQGGISMQQVTLVRNVQGVTVAAPVGVVAVDYLVGEAYAIDLTKLPHSGDLTVYRLTSSEVTDGGATKVQGDTTYAIVEGTAPPFLAAEPGARTPMNIDGYVVDCPDFCYGPSGVFPDQAVNTKLVDRGASS